MRSLLHGAIHGAPVCEGHDKCLPIPTGTIIDVMSWPRPRLVLLYLERYGMVSLGRLIHLT